ncbi:hypothetical protein KTO58_09250 [Chitinophaga pendula]|nr:hypothetical protein [Chitinophaga pendula]UCJ09353.1 hypothetical protein KTO58_09250 [Chitinophaga pendula]
MDGTIVHFIAGFVIFTLLFVPFTQNSQAALSHSGNFVPLLSSLRILNEK